MKMISTFFLSVVIAITGISALDCPRCIDHYDITTCTATQTCQPNEHDVCELQVHPHDNFRVDYHCFNTHACVNHEDNHCDLKVEQTCSFCCDSIDACDRLLTGLLGTTLPPTTPTTTVYICDTQADIVLLLDTSGSIQDADYQTMLQFVSSLTQNFDVGPNGVQFGTIIFSTNANKIFDLNTYTNNTQIAQAISQIPHIGGSTYTNLALDMALNDSLTDQNGARPGVPKIVIVFTDGQSTDSAATAQSAANLHNAGVSVMSIGVGSAVDPQELDTIASSPDDVFQVAGFDVLDTIEGAIANNTCYLSG